MPMSEYLHGLRQRVGHDLLVMPAASVFVLDARRRLLLACDAGMDLWAAPGGAIEPDETPADAAVREMWEETGLSVTLSRVLGVYGGQDFRITYPNGDVVSYCVIAFAAEISGGAMRPDGVEVAELGWFSEREAAALAMGAWTRIMVRDAFASAERTAFGAPTWRP
ncbi:MAG TPA: NUDIX domain-containing protein [Geminicoccaceae bacterium]|nr:NUDIX domain-containing protein [Geminicoccaceae bacterium]